MQPPASLPGRGLVRPQRLMPVLGVSGVSRLSRGRVSTGGALQCRATAACFGYIHLQQYPEIHMPVELARKALAASLALSEGTGSSVPLVHHSIIQGTLYSLFARLNERCASCKQQQWGGLQAVARTGVSCGVLRLCANARTSLLVLCPRRGSQRGYTVAHYSLRPVCSPCCAHF